MVSGKFILLAILGFVLVNSEAFSLDKIPDIPKLPDVITDPLDKIVFSNTCLADLGCFFTGSPFYHPIYRPISLPPFSLKHMKTKFWLFTPSSSLNDTNGTLISADAKSINDSSFEKDLPVKFLIHGFLTDLQDKEKDDRYQGEIYDNIRRLQIFSNYVKFWPHIVCPLLHRLDSNLEHGSFRVSLSYSSGRLSIKHYSTVMKNVLLKEGSYNVIIVDWTCCNGRPYPQAVANARVVGAQLAQMIKFLQEHIGVEPTDVHLIGHSLGAHISGWAGERTPNLGRISGLDPAGPYFRFGEKEICLDKSDADFLDVIHSNTGNIAFEGLGVKEAIGDIDFYPNGGGHQPGCEPTLLNFTVAGINVTAVGDGEGITSLLATSCDHNRATKLYIATIDSSKCKFMGTQCETYEKFQKGECNDGKKIRMGFHAQKDPKIPEGFKYFFNTGDVFPFCTEEPKIKDNDTATEE